MHHLAYDVVALNKSYNESTLEATSSGNSATIVDPEQNQSIRLYKRKFQKT